MNITYKIENYYPAEKRCFVVYQNGDLPPMGEWVYISDAMTQSEIQVAVLAATPIHKWGSAANQNIVALIGTSVSEVYTAPVEPVTPAPVVDLESQARRTRNGLLKSSDWTQLVDSPLNDAQRATWSDYRQALRAIPEQTGFPDQIDWPVAPNA
jgi:hypothetical protein